MNKQEHLLVLLSEECNEVGQRASKALRFGLKEIQPSQKQDNAQRIVYEFSQLYAIMEMLKDEGYIDKIIDEDEIANKKYQIKKYSIYSENLGILINPDKNTPRPSFHNPELICFKCEHIGLPRNKRVFSTNHNNKRQCKDSSHCEKCDTELINAVFVFNDEKEENETKQQLRERGLAWIDK